MNVKRLERPVQKIEFDHAGRKTIVEFDDRQISVRHTKWHLELDTSARLLHHLSTSIPHEFTSDGEAVRKVRISWFWLIGAIVVYFSDYNGSIPLLAPALLLLWLVFLLPNARNAMPRWWLSINDDYGTLLVRIRTVRPGSEDDPSKQEAFVTALRRAIEVAKQKEYGLAEHC